VLNTGIQSFSQLVQGTVRDRTKVTGSAIRHYTLSDEMEIIDHG